MLKIPLQRPLRGWFFLFLAINIVDLVSTFFILQQGLVKGNPVAGFLLQHVGIVMVMVLKVVLIALAILGINQVAKRSPDALNLACNLLIGLSGIVLLVFTVNAAQCAITYF